MYDFLVHHCNYIALSCVVCEIYDLLVENREIFIPHLYLAHTKGVTPSE